MNENDKIITLENEKLASILRKKRKKLHTLDGEVYMSDKEVADLFVVSHCTL